MELRRLGRETTGRCRDPPRWPRVRAGYSMTDDPAQPKIVRRASTSSPIFSHCPLVFRSRHNFTLGKPTAAQEKLADAYVQTAQTIVSNFKAGNNRDVHAAVLDKLGALGSTSTPFRRSDPAWVMGPEWYPAIIGTRFPRTGPRGERRRGGIPGDERAGCVRDAAGMSGARHEGRRRDALQNAARAFGDRHIGFPGECNFRIYA